MRISPNLTQNKFIIIYLIPHGFYLREHIPLLFHYTKVPNAVDWDAVVFVSIPPVLRSHSYHLRLNYHSFDLNWRPLRTSVQKQMQLI